MPDPAVGEDGRSDAAAHATAAGGPPRAPRHLRPEYAAVSERDWPRQPPASTNGTKPPEVEAPPGGPRHLRHLGAAVDRGVRWTAISLTGKQAGRLVVSLILARLLGPHNYGIIGQATIFTMFVSFLLDGGFGAAYIQRRAVDAGDEGAVWIFSLGSTAVMMAITVAIAPVLAVFFHTRELVDVVRVLSLDVLFMGLAIAPTALLTRRFAFKHLAASELVGTFVGGVCCIVAAAMGAGYWALVVFTIVSDGATFVVVAIACGLPRIRWSSSSLVQMFSFGIGVISTQILYFVVRNADDVLVGRYLGATALGLYSLSYRVLQVPQKTLGYMVNRVSLPVFSRLQDDRPRMGQYFLRATNGAAFLAFPMMTLVAVAAHQAVPLVFGHRWVPAVTSMEIIAVAGSMAATQHLFRPLLYASGKPRMALLIQVEMTVTAITAFAIGVRWGINGVSWGVLIVFWTSTPLFAYVAGREARFGVGRYFRQLLAPAAGSIVLAVVYKAVHAGVREVAAPGAVTVIVCSIAALLSYAVIVRLGWPDDFANGVDLVRRVVRPAARRAAQPMVSAANA